MLRPSRRRVRRSRALWEGVTNEVGRFFNCRKLDFVGQTMSDRRSQFGRDGMDTALRSGTLGPAGKQRPVNLIACIALANPRTSRPGLTSARIYAFHESLQASQLAIVAARTQLAQQRGRSDDLGCCGDVRLKRSELGWSRFTRLVARCGSNNPSTLDNAARTVASPASAFRINRRKT